MNDVAGIRARPRNAMADVDAGVPGVDGDMADVAEASA